MALVDYGSDSDTEQQLPPKSTRIDSLDRNDDKHDNEQEQEEEEEFDPTDAFGINKLQTIDPAAAASTTLQRAGGVNSAKSAPEVISSVNYLITLHIPLSLLY